MEFVSGETLAEKARQLHRQFAESGHALRKTFELTVLRPLISRFVSVCNTVAYAHSQGVIHRDIKPANVMLGDFGATYVVDWGLARLESASMMESKADAGMPSIVSTGETVVSSGSVTNDHDANLLTDTLTKTGSVMGTPAFMSPEQAAGNTAAIGRASDQYSLGATLWFLLTGRTAIVGQGNMNWLEQLTSGSIPRPTSIQSLVPKPLESICMKAMSLQPTDRYASVTDFAADLDRWLADQPVSTTRETLLDKLARFTRHHQAASLTFLIASALIAVIASAASVRINVQKNVAIKAKDESRAAAIAETKAKEAAVLSATAERVANERAQRRLAQVERANGTLASVFENLDPAEVAKNEEPLQVLLVRQIEKVIAELDGESIGDAIVVAELQNKLGKSLLSLSEPAKAIPVLRKALAAHEAALGKSHAETIRCQLNLGDAFQSAGDFAQAIPMFEEAVALARASLDDSVPQKTAAMNNLGSAYLETGKIPEAITLFEEALNIRKQRLGPKDPGTVLSMNELAMGLGAAGRRDESLALLQDVARLTVEIHGVDDPRTMTSTNNLAIALFSGGRSRESLPLFEDTLKRRKSMLGREHIDTLGSMNNLAANYQALSMWPEALSLLEEAETLTAKKFGELHPGHLFTINNLGFVYLRMEQPDKAVPIFERTLSLRQQALGDDHPDTLSTRLNLGIAHIAVGHPDAGLTYLEQAFTGRLAKLGIEHPKTFEAMLKVTAEYQNTGRTADADRLFQQAIAAFPDADRQQSAAYAQVLAGFASHHLQLQRWVDAETALRECLAIRQKLQPDSVTTFSTQSMLGEALLGQRELAEAEQLLLAAYHGLKAQEHSIPTQQSARLPEAVDRLIQYYDVVGLADEKTRWQSVRAMYAKDVSPEKPKKQ